jgi:hypothetical protein
MKKNFKGAKAGPTTSGGHANTPDPNVSEGLKGHKKNVIAPKQQGGSGSKGPASPL